MKTFYAAHNEYLELLLTTGVLGLAAWLWFVVGAPAQGRAELAAPRGRAGHAGAGQLSWPTRSVSIRVSMIFPEIMLLFGLLQVFCLPPEGEDAPIQPKRQRGQTACAEWK